MRAISTQASAVSPQPSGTPKAFNRRGRRDRAEIAETDHRKEFTVIYPRVPSSSNRDSSVCMAIATCLPAARAEVFTNADGVVASPGAVWAKICLPKISITRAQAIEKKMLSHARLESLAEIDCCAPGMFYADGIERPRVESLRNIPSKEKPGLAEEHKAAELAASEGTDFQQARKHVAGKGVARRIYAAELTGIRGADVGVDFVVRRRYVELAVPPEHI